ncbi:MAG: alpha/beta hydrolase [Nocardiaceae bacterium]|nr:alpha/beta hydrolase [Nocardiaceae bacterium]
MNSIPGLEYAETTAGGVLTRYFTGGNGPAVIFLHGWGLAGTPLYFNALSQLSRSGHRVYAPLLPGFGSSGLPESRFTLSGFARWVADFVESVGLKGPIALAGYSFGGGIAIQTALDHPGLVDRLVLVNSIGGAEWIDAGGQVKHVRHRPLWDWGRGMGDDVTDRGHVVKLMPSIFRAGLAHLVRHSDVLWRSGQLARTSDLTSAVQSFSHRGLPVAIVWSREDKVVPQRMIASLRAAIGSHLWITVDGGHCWLNSNQTRFCDIIAGILTAPAAALRGEVHHLPVPVAA